MSARLSSRQAWTAHPAYRQAGTLFGEPVAPQLTRRRNAHPEQGVLNAVLKVLEYHPLVAWCCRMNSGGYKTPDGRFVRFGFVGCSDIIGMMRSGKFLAIETKAQRGVVSEAQRAFLERVQRHGGVAGIARSIDDAKRIVELA